MANIPDPATIATLSTKLDGAIAQIADLKDRFDAFQLNFIRQDVYTLKHEEILKQVAQNTTEIYHLQKNRWLWPMASLILGGVLTFLINYAITH